MRLLAGLAVLAILRKIRTAGVGVAALAVSSSALAALTMSSSNFTRVSSTTASLAITIPTDVPAGAMIPVCVRAGTTGTTVVSISDPVNGTWPGGALRQGPTANDINASLYALENSAALTGSTNRTLTVTFSGSVVQYVIAGWISSNVGTIEFSSTATAFVQTPSGATNADSNTVSVPGAGGIFGCLLTTDTQASVVTMDGAGEVVLGGTGASQRGYLVGQAVASAGTHGFEATLTTSSEFVFQVGAFLESSIATITGVSKVQSGKAATIDGTDFASSSNVILVCPTDDSAGVDCETQTAGSESSTEIVITSVALPTGSDPGDTIYLFVDNGSGFNVAGFSALVADPALIPTSSGGSSLFRDRSTGVSVDAMAVRTLVLRLDEPTATLVYEGDHDIATGVLDEIADAAFSIDEIADMTEFLIVFPVGGGAAPASVVDRND